MNAIKVGRFVSLFVVLCALLTIGCDREVLTSQELVDRYPDVAYNSGRSEDARILCPFLRMLERSGIFDDSADLVVPTDQVADGAREFGVNRTASSIIANIAANGQDSPKNLDLLRLHEAGFIAHDCGLTFALDGTQVSNSVRSSTLARLSQLADANGRLLYSDIETVKLEICSAQGVKATSAGILETKLIYAYLGGVERGYVDYSDVERLLNAQMPETKATGLVDGGMLKAVQ